MLFNSWQFGVFLPIVFGLYWSVPQRFRWALILIASYWFYMSWNVKYIVLILFTTIISYMAGIFLERYRGNKPVKKFILAFTLISCLGVLFVFKYFNFFAGAVVDFLNMFALHLHPTTLTLLLPVGISFYTFQTLAYVIDVYRGNTKAEHHFGVYAAFISFFPQLVAGPIERTNNLLPQIKAAPDFDYAQATYGMKLMTWGFFKKLAVADVVAVYSDRVFNDVYSYKGFALVLAMFFFTVQIYCDFSGYSDIARGCAKLFGIDLMENFKSPYFSATIREFWSRWHISLSTWFRDYVYIPLGGNRCGKFRRNVNLIITFIVSGLWHGANWTFIAWGAVHGLAQVIENAFVPKNYEPHGIGKALRVCGVFGFCMLAWVLFRANSISEALYVYMSAVSARTSQVLGKDNTKVIKSLAEEVIKSGNSIDFKNRNGDTALNLAAVFNVNPEVVHILLNAGADIESKNSFGFTPLMSSLDNPNPEVMKALVKAGANMSVYDSSGMPLLANCVMCIQGDLMHSTPAHLRALIELGADVDTRAKTDKGQTALMLAVLFTLQPEVIEILVGSTKHINMKSFDGLSAYSLALGIDNPASAALANKNVRLNLENNKAAISILEAHGAKISFPELCSCASAERVKKAIDSGADINVKNSEGITPLIASIKYNPDKGVFSALLKEGVNVNVADSENVTALMAAIACNLDTSLIIEILAAVDNLNAQDIRGYTAFDVAIELERYDVASLIETLGGRANLYRR